MFSRKELNQQLTQHLERKRQLESVLQQINKELSAASKDAKQALLVDLVREKQKAEFALRQINKDIQSSTSN